MVCAATHDDQSNGQVMMATNDWQTNSQVVIPNDFHTHGQQLFLVPVMPVTTLTWQSNDSTPTDTACWEMPMTWAQPVPYTNSDCSVAPQQYGTIIGMVAFPAEMPMAAEEVASEDGYNYAVEAYGAETYGKSVISASTARRQRRQRASERAAARAKASALAQACALSDASTSDGDDSPITGVEGQKIEEIMEQLNAGGEARSAAISALAGSVWRLSRDPLGCRAVQLALELASSSGAKALVAELHGHVEAAIYSPHANYVIQKIIEAMPMPVSSFVAEELRGNAANVARHRFGCRIFCRLLEHCGAFGGASAELINESIANAEELVRHTFGHYVAKTLLEHGTPEQKQRIAYALCAGPAGGLSGEAGLMRNAMHRNASYVMEKALAHLDPLDSAAIAKELLRINGSVMTLGQSPFGSHVVKGMLRISDVAEVVQSHLLHHGEHLRNTKYGNKLLQEVGLGFSAQ